MTSTGALAFTLGMAVTLICVVVIGIIAIVWVSIQQDKALKHVKPCPHCGKIAPCRHPALRRALEKEATP